MKSELLFLTRWRMISYSYTSDSRPAHPPPPYTQSQPDGRVTLKVRKHYFTTYPGFLLLLSSSSPHRLNLCPYRIVIFSLIKLSSSHSHNYYHPTIIFSCSRFLCSSELNFKFYATWSSPSPSLQFQPQTNISLLLPSPHPHLLPHHIFLSSTDPNNQL